MSELCWYLNLCVCVCVRVRACVSLPLSLSLSLVILHLKVCQDSDILHVCHMTDFGEIISVIEITSLIFILNYYLRAFSANRIQVVESIFYVYFLFTNSAHSKTTFVWFCSNCKWNAYKNCAKISSVVDVTAFLICYRKPSFGSQHDHAGYL
jgi:predicted GNAT superfamily acetyltransferase